MVLIAIIAVTAVIVTTLHTIEQFFEGTVVSDDGGKYFTVKHDNFAGEVFDKSQCEIELV